MSLELQDDRIELCEAELPAVTADAVVVEDSGQLRAARGYASTLDRRYEELRPLREQAVFASPLALGSAVAFRAADGRVVVWAVTYGDAAHGQPEQAIRATPLDIAAAAREALLRAAEHGAGHVALPALGTRYGRHVLPPLPKKLPRYVMAAAQLIGIREALAATDIRRVTLCLTQRDRAIFAAVLGRGEAEAGDGDV